MTILHDANIPPEDHEAFGKWAFGEDWGILRISDALEAWNARHGKLLIVTPSDKRIETTLRMYELWKEQVQ